jgi:hypothetical protein
MSIRYGLTPVRWRCFACHERGKLWELVDNLADLRKEPELKELAARLLDTDKLSLEETVRAAMGDTDAWLYPVEREPVPTLDEGALERFPSVWDVPRALDYLRRRVPYAATIRAFDLRYDPGRDRLLFPVRLATGGLVGAVGRLLVEGEPRYWNYFGFESGQHVGGLDRLAPGAWVYVVEGFFDLLRIWKWAWDAGAGVVCTWTSTLYAGHVREIGELARSVGIWYDGDSAGRSGWEQAKETLGPSTFALRRAAISEGMDPGQLTEAHFHTIRSKMEGATT